MLNNIIKIEIYSNNFLIGQKTLKRNISNFAQNHDVAMALIDSLPTSLKRLSEIYNLGFL
jgi:hypothetical protein